MTDYYQRERYTRSMIRHFFTLTLLLLAVSAHALDRQPFAAYQARRHALAEKLQGGTAIFFANHEPALEYQDYRQDEDFYYLTGWNEPGAALLIEAAAPAVTDPLGGDHPGAAVSRSTLSADAQSAYRALYRCQARRSYPRGCSHRRRRSRGATHRDGR